MRRTIFLMAVIISIIAYQTSSAESQINNQDKEGIENSKVNIKAVLKSYEWALNNSDVDKVMRLYTRDGVFMPSNKPTAIGYAQVTKAYQHVFKDLDLEVSFHIDEIVVRGDLAFARTVSDGEIRLLNKKINIKNNSRELFVMKRADHSWKIYRYMFNEAGPQH
ncbi:MAG TPA: DUF4440 domain-containing protein [Nitrospirae bacterium]|nr:DUF4440 domain-containing protein [Nitrospirota bacterium]